MKIYKMSKIPPTYVVDIPNLVRLVVVERNRRGKYILQKKPATEIEIRLCKLLNTKHYRNRLNRL